MDKETLSNYGWIVIAVLVLSVMIALSTPFGNFISEAVKSTTQGLFDVNQNALDAAGIVMGDQEFDDSGSGGVSTPQTNEYGFYFNQPYQTMMDGALYEYVFYKDGDASLWASMGDEHMGQYIPTGTCTYEDKTIIIGGDPATLSEDGKTLSAPGMEMVMKPTTIGTIQYGVSYENVGEGISVVFREDGSLEMYQGDTIVDTLLAGSVTVNEYTFDLTVGNETMPCPIYPNGSKVMIGELVLVVGCTHENTEIIDIEPTCAEEGMSGAEVCTVCGKVVKPGTSVPKTNTHKNTELKNAKTPSCNTDGYTGDTYCNDCKTTIETGTTIPSTGNHTSDDSSGICSGCGYAFKGTYFVGVTSNKAGNYTGATAVYTNTADFPQTPSDGDVYVYGNYEYRYNYYYYGNSYDTPRWMYDGNQNGWSVRCLKNIADPGSIVESINGYPVTHMRDTFRGYSALTMAPIIPSNITYIGSAFMDCTSLTIAPKIPNSITNMQSTFSGCTSLRDLNGMVIPSGVTSLTGTFQYCTSLTDLSDLTIPSNVAYMNSTFMKCTSLTIAPNMSNATGITSLDQAFLDCTSLTVVPNISNCTKLTNMKNAFNGCKSLTDLSSMIVPSSVTSLYSTFGNCTSLTVAPNLSACVNLTEMISTFQFCEQLVTAPDLSNCKKLTNMSSAFSCCSSLTTAPIIPSSVKYMQQTFIKCSSLSGVITINATPTSYSGCFSSVDMSRITLAGSCDSALKQTLANTGKNGSSVSIVE